MNNQNEAGERYFCIKLSTQKDIYVFAEQVEIVNGAIVLRARDGQISFALASGQWEYCYAASCTDGSPLAIEHWRETPTLLPPNRKQDRARYPAPASLETDGRQR
jgi:hypothetical protein